MRRRGNNRKNNRTTPLLAAYARKYLASIIWLMLNICLCVIVNIYELYNIRDCILVVEFVITILLWKCYGTKYRKAAICILVVYNSFVLKLDDIKNIKDWVLQLYSWWNNKGFTSKITIILFVTIICMIVTFIVGAVKRKIDFNRIKAVLYRKKIMYIAIVAGLTIITVIIKIKMFSELDIMKAIILIVFINIIGIFMGLYIFEPIENIRNHPFLLMISLFFIIMIVCAMIMLDFNIEDGKRNISGIENYFIVLNAVAIGIAIFCMLIRKTEVIQKNDNKDDSNEKIKNTQNNIFGILIINFFILLIYQIAIYKQGISKQNVIILFMILLIADVIYEMVLYIYKEYKKTSGRNNYHTIILLIFAVWSIIFLAICIIRWTLYPDSESLLNIIMEIAVYLSIALFVTILLTALVIFSYTIVKKIIEGNKKFEIKDIGMVGVFLSVLIFIIVITYYRENSKIGKMINDIENGSIPLDKAILIIAYIAASIIIAISFAILFYSLLGDKFWENLKKFLKNEDHIKEALEFRKSSWEERKSNKQNNTGEEYLSQDIRNILALYVAEFTVKLRDFIMEIIKDTFGQLSNGGLVQNIIEDLKELFINEEK